MCIAGNSKTFASGSYDKTVRIWKMNDGEIVHVLEGDYCLTPNIRTLYLVLYSQPSIQRHSLKQQNSFQSHFNMHGMSTLY